MTTKEVLLRAKAACEKAYLLSSDDKNRALSLLADSLLNRQTEILAANEQDLAAAGKTVSPVMLDRLRLNEERIAAMADGIRQVIALPDPCGRVLSRVSRENGLVIEKLSVPIGVVAMIYESRPNVTADAAALLLKSGNVCVLRGGKEASRTGLAMVSAMKSALLQNGFDPDLIGWIEDSSRASAAELMTARDTVDLLIPRGGKGLIDACVQNATVPCIQTGTGICHVYVDRLADLSKAVRIIENAKMSRPSVCNAEEVCLVHQDVAESFLPMLYHQLVEERKAQGKPVCELRLCEKAARIIPGKAAGEADFDTEFLDYILAVRVVENLEEAIRHIARHSTHHSDAILTEDTRAARRFCAAVDSAAVYVNASTRFTDGGEFGFGCEIGISTQKLHARGPMGLNELTTYKYLVRGNGQIR